MNSRILHKFFVTVGLLTLTLGCGKPSDQRGNGGSPGLAGATRSGGLTATGGNAAAGTSTSGDSQGSGGATGGSTSFAGSPGRGGVTSAGGSARAGGTTSEGGHGGAGGTSTDSSGGSSADHTSAIGGVGGTTSSGGNTSLGGSVASRDAGARDGSAATGGATVAGGTDSGGGTVGTGGVTGDGGASHTGKWQIMLLGDSITGTTCYPKLLSQELISKGHSHFDFIGTVQNNQACGSAPNVQTEGHGGYLVTYLTTDSPPQSGKGTLSELKSWAAEAPEVVLIEYGTNDAWSSIATQSILDAYGFVVDQFRAHKPNVIFFVAQITPLNPSGCSSCEANVEALNAKIPSWAASKSTSASPIYVVNVWASLPASTYTPNSAYTSDGCHPNPAGSQLMADAWYAGIVAEQIP